MSTADVEDDPEQDMVSTLVDPTVLWGNSWERFLRCPQSQATARSPLWLHVVLTLDTATVSAVTHSLGESLVPGR